MAFRRKRFMRRRRGRRSETYTLVECQDCHNVYGDMPCGGAFIHAIELMTMHTPRNALSDATEVTSGSDRYVTVAGVKFQAELSHDPATTLAFPACDPSPLSLAFLLRVWEALVVLPFAQGTQIPAYLPDFTSGINQSGDLADRVLWKRISILPIWGLNTTNPVPQLETTIRDEGHGPVVVKTKVRLDERHGLYYVQCYSHDVFGLGSVIDSCIANETTNPCVIPIKTDAWFKTFVHAIR